MKGLPCAYCGGRRGATTDHLIKSAHVTRRVVTVRQREHPRYKVAACFECNVRIYTLCRVPASHTHLIDELEAITGDTYSEWNGDPATLYPVAV